MELPEQKRQSMTLAESSSKRPDLRNCKRVGATERSLILIGCYRKTDAGDPEVYQRAVISVLMRYPESIAIAVTEPATGIPSRLKWLPAIAEIVEACEMLMEPILRQLEREKTAEEQRKLLAGPPPAPRLSAEEVDKLLSTFRLRSMPDATVPRSPDGRHHQRAMDDLTARKRRRDVLGGPDDHQSP